MTCFQCAFSSGVFAILLVSCLLVILYHTSHPHLHSLTVNDLEPHVYVFPFPKMVTYSLRVTSLSLCCQKSTSSTTYNHTYIMSSSPSDIPAPLVHIVASISAIIDLISEAFHRIPGSPIIIRYIRSSYQNDPWRSLLEVLLVAFALRTVLKGRTRGDGQSKSFIKFSNKVSCFAVEQCRAQRTETRRVRAIDEGLGGLSVN